MIGDAPSELKAGKFNDYVSSAAAVLGVMSTGLAGYLSYTTAQLQQQAAQQNDQLQALRLQQDDAARAFDQQLRLAEAQRAKEQFYASYYIQVYDKVISAVEKGDNREQIIALVLVNSLQDSDFKTSLAKIFEAPSVMDRETQKRAADIAKTSEANTMQAAALGNPRGWNYDVFWCEGDQANKAIAEALASAIQADPEVGRVRIRPLATVINQRPGYQVHGNQIRAEPSEQVQANQLKQALDPLVAKPFDIVVTGSTTPSYLSVFACSGKE